MVIFLYAANNTGNKEYQQEYLKNYRAFSDYIS